MTLGEFLKNKRIEQKLTQKELAEKLKIDYHLLQKWELNLSKPNLKNGLKLYDLLNFDLEEFKQIVYNQD
jgi:DNA-binding helix-turn-helix protein